jgi:ribonuclease J
MVDGLGVGDVGQIVLRDRKTMAQDGMFVIVAIIDTNAHKTKDNIDIISRGFVYLKESKKLLNDTRVLVKELLNNELAPGRSVNSTHLREILREKVGSFLFEQTRRRPMVLPVIIEA